MTRGPEYHFGVEEPAGKALIGDQVCVSLFFADWSLFQLQFRGHPLCFSVPKAVSLLAWQALFESRAMKTQRDALNAWGTDSHLRDRELQCRILNNKKPSGQEAQLFMGQLRAISALE